MAKGQNPMASRNHSNGITHTDLVHATARIIDGKPKVYILPCGKVANGVLYLQCTPSKVIDGECSVSKSWLWRTYEGTGKARKSLWYGVGSFDPNDQLAFQKAQIAAAQKAAEVAAGTVRTRRERTLEAKANGQPGGSRKRFAEAAEAYVVEFTPTWRAKDAATNWRGIWKNWVNPIIGDLYVDEITPEHVLSVLRQKIAGEEGDFWLNRTKSAVATRARIESVLKWSGEPGRRWRLLGSNPASRESLGTLPRPSKVSPTKEHPALDYAQVPALMETLDLAKTSKIHPTVKAAMAFLVLTGVRTREVRWMTWPEVDLKARVWALPPSRTKKERQHRVPLSDKAIEILQEMKRRHPKSDAVFPSIYKLGGRFLSNTTLWYNLKKIHPDVVVHGFRSTFSMWAGERAKAPYQVCETAIAHVVGTKTGRAYDRSDYFEDRIPLMRDWATFCLTGKTIRWRPLDEETLEAAQ
jgi:integrase